MRNWSSVAVPRIPGEGRPLRLYDTAAGEILPITPGRVARMYVCGITPYDATHIGHAATYLAFDLVHRVWLDNGHQVDYVQNVTDVDEPLIERAARDGNDWVVLGMCETALFREDMEALRVLPPKEFVGAVESISEIADAVHALVQQGVAYRLDDQEFPDIYFDHTTSAKFGYESRYDEATMMRLFSERGGDPDRRGKRHPLDALLWRTVREGEPSWLSELGQGRPGWHIECSVIAVNRLGTGFDIQGGGSDLIFPHHEYSAAHAEALTGAHPFAQHYVHAGMVKLNGEKMSKSRGNLVFVSRLRSDGVESAAVRLALLAGHYRSDRSWTPELLSQAQARLHRWREALTSTVGPAAEPTIEEIRMRLADDLDTPGALAVVDRWVERARTGAGDQEPAPLRQAVDALLGVEVSEGDASTIALRHQR